MRLRLIDGRELTRLMMRHKVCVFGTAHRREPCKVTPVQAGEVPVEVGLDLVGVLLAPVAEVYGEVADVVGIRHPGIVRLAGTPLVPIPGLSAPRRTIKRRARRSRRQW